MFEQDAFQALRNTYSEKDVFPLTKHSEFLPEGSGKFGTQRMSLEKDVSLPAKVAASGVQKGMELEARSASKNIGPGSTAVAARPHWMGTCRRETR